MSSSSTGKRDAASIIASASRPTRHSSTTKSYRNDDRRGLWCETQWTNLSQQAKTLGLPVLPYFDPETMLLSKEINHKLWIQLERLWDYLGPEKAPYASPIMIEGGEVKWHSFLPGDKGDEVEVYSNIVDKFMSGAPRPGHYDD
ncbi:uncharacterized protein PV06_09841 [Exophiala oligosperma]|uniref:Uncharacterized protein n=1 Tax=Exophiala oligosperma TaxID=215243 RepID=A0A0D2AC09_9EURO|nr:uncharacterized protein PV06_09841 [Exophiala oligosperma]KIW37856.1 hypothetical protein PV06_09841 [Exophiala oligosperma]